MSGRRLGRRAAKKRQRGSAGGTETKQKGAAEFRKAADEALARESKNIAESLAESCKKGHIQSMKFLYELAELSSELGESEGARRFRSLAEVLGAELPQEAEGAAGNDGPERAGEEASGD